jgi:hypothetical protein
MRARLRARTVGLVTTTSSILRVFQRLEPIADVLGDIPVLAIVAGMDAEGWVSDLRGECKCRYSDLSFGRH